MLMMVVWYGSGACCRHFWMMQQPWRFLHMSMQLSAIFSKMRPYTAAATSESASSSPSWQNLDEVISFDREWLPLMSLAKSTMDGASTRVYTSNSSSVDRASMMRCDTRAPFVLHATVTMLSPSSLTRSSTSENFCSLDEVGS
ncbi:hypothetical protein NQL31_001455 [Lotmaria passim]